MYEIGHIIKPKVMKNSISCRLLFLVVSFVAFVQATPMFWGSHQDTTSKTSWKSMLVVDPSNIVSLMIKHGGLIVPKSIEKDIKLLAEVCHTEHCELNVIQKRLVLRNFSIRFPSAEMNALQIGKVCLKWDSYLKPCIEVEMDDVQILVEFFNLLLTKSNWEELQNYGFPPKFEEYYEGSSTSTENDTFLRVGSIDLNGNMEVLLKSRPLDKEITKIDLNLDETLDPLTKKIHELSEQNQVEFGRRGCTTEEIETLIQKYVGGIIRKAVTGTIEDIVVEGGAETKGKVTNMVGATKKRVSEYLEEAVEFKGEQIEQKISRRLQGWEESLGGKQKSALNLAKQLGQARMKSRQQKQMQQGDQPEREL